jgi:hypothetical protein
MSVYQRNIQAFIQVIESESNLFSPEDWDDLKKLVKNLPGDDDEISEQIQGWLQLETRSQIRIAVDKRRDDISSESNSSISNKTLGPGSTKSPTQPNQPSESSKELLDNVIKKNSTSSNSQTFNITSAPEINAGNISSS